MASPVISDGFASMAFPLAGCSFFYMNNPLMFRFLRFRNRSKSEYQHTLGNFFSAINDKRKPPPDLSEGGSLLIAFNYI